MRVTGKYVFFWTASDVYSNFYPSIFEHKGIIFNWAEQAIMYRKAKLFGADDIAESILKAQSPKECKRLGRSKRIPFDEDVWVENREKIFKEVLLDKFSKPELKKQILTTGNREFVEASPYDRIWGVGLRENHPHITDPSKWRGLNLLGKILTEVRDEIQKKGD